jgi:hypothetical protein
MKKPVIVHPFLLALFPILSLWSHNVTQVSMSETLMPAALVLGLTVLLFCLSAFIFRDGPSAGILASGTLMMVFAYGPAVDVMRHWWQLPPLVRNRPSALLIWTAVFLVGMYALMKSRRRWPGLTRLLNIVAAAVVALPLIHIGTYKLTTQIGRPETPSSQDLKTTLDAPAAGDLSHAGPRPDIYYIILDRYARADILEGVYGFDNSEFLTGLSQRGFYVASESRANYLKTAHSLASSLNMEFLDDLKTTVGETSSDWLPIYSKLRDYKVWRFLKSRGYQYIHVGSWWAPTSKNKHADLNVNLHSLSEFSRVLHQTTMLYPLGANLGAVYLHDVYREQWKRILYELEKLAEIPKIKEPTFVFAHFLIPHDPYVFDRDGRFLTREEARKRSRTQNYINQLIFTNHKIAELIDNLLSNSEQPPIIVLQSDEGPFPIRYELDEKNFDWRQATAAELTEKFGILSAYYLPPLERRQAGEPASRANEEVNGWKGEGVKRWSPPHPGPPASPLLRSSGFDPHRALYSSITPVNSFRLIFNLYFNADFKLLPDESYAFADQSRIYQFFSVTALINKK